MKKLFFAFLLLISAAQAQIKPVKNAPIKLSVNPKSGIKLGVVTNPGGNGQTANTNGEFTLNIDPSVTRISTGVYNSSKVLVRTLQSNIAPDDLIAQWDGKLDNGEQAPNGDYEIRALTNNVTYTAIGEIGNTSASRYENRYGNFGFISTLSSTPNKNFIGYGFYEGEATASYFNKDDIQKCVRLDNGAFGITISSCTDGTNVYYAVGDQYQGKHYVYGVKISDNSNVSFTNQVSLNTGRGNQGHSDNLILVSSEEVNNQYLGIGVNSSFLFVTQNNDNVVRIVNKQTGSKVKDISIAGAKRIAVNNNNVWILANDGTVKKYLFDSDLLTLTFQNVTTTSVFPLSLDFNSDGSKILVTEGGNKNQVCEYDNNNGSLIRTLGIAGGYINSPAVTNNKFCFNAPLEPGGFAKYDSNGGLWVYDQGNYRLLHFNADLSYKETISYIPSTRSICIDQNDATKIFADELEFKRDYNKPLDNGANGSWKLVNNWKLNVDVDLYGRFSTITTLLNNHTYAQADQRLYDLTANGAVYLGNYYGRIEADGSLWNKDFPNNERAIINKQPLTGFDSNYKPLFGSSVTLATTPTFATNPNQPVYYSNNVRGASTNPNKIFFFNETQGVKFNGVTTGYGYHFGAINTGGNTWNFQTSDSAPNRYIGQFPTDGTFDLTGNNANCLANVNGSNVFWHVNGELGRFTEVCYTAHYNEDGLMIGFFGTDNVAAVRDGTDFLAGNSFKTQLTKVGNDLYYMYSDENSHFAVPVIKISNLSSIKEVSIPVIVSDVVIPITQPAYKLSATLPLKSDSYFNKNGWVMNPAQAESGWSVKTTINSLHAYDNDINIYSDGNQGGSYRTVSKSLGTVNSSNWTETFDVRISGNPNDNYNVDLLDDAGKVLVKFHTKYDLYYVNDIQYSSKYSAYALGRVYEHITVKNSNGVLSLQVDNYPAFTLSSYESGGNISKPATFQVRAGGSGGTHTEMSISNLKFKSGI